MSSAPPLPPGTCTTRLANCLVPCFSSNALKVQDIYIDDNTGLITSPTSVRGTSTSPTTTIDCTDSIVSPGFIDIQLNGAYGVDFSSPVLTPTSINHVSTSLLSTGVTSYCPTLVSLSAPQYAAILPTFEALVDPSVLGVHAEGPFFNTKMRGAHLPANILDPCFPSDDSVPSDASSVVDSVGSIFESIYSSKPRSPIILTTLAPELHGSLPLIEHLTSLGVTVSMGHTAATYEQGLAGIDSGATLLTHLYNQMTPFHHRNPGLIPLIALPPNDNLSSVNARTPPYYSIISDGIHCAPPSVRMAWAMSKKAILVTDAMAAMGLPDGDHKLGSMSVTKKGIAAHLTNTATLAGSVVSLDFCVRQFRDFSGCSVVEALQVVTKNPADLLNQKSIGNLDVGSKADLVRLDKDSLEVLQTFKMGKSVYERE